MAALKESQNWFVTYDGIKLFYRTWMPEKQANKAVILFHRGHEHSGRLADLVQALQLEDTAFFAWDARGHGQSPGERGYAESFSCLVKDADCFVRYIVCQHNIPMENIVVLGVSVGAVLVSAWVHDYAPTIRAMVLAAPAFCVKLYVPFALPLLRIYQKLRPKSFIKSYVKANMLTHDPVEAERYNKDPLISRSIAVNILTDLDDTSRRVIADAGAIVTPTLLLVAGSDWVVKSSVQKKFFAGLSSSAKQLQEYPGFYHAIYHEKDRDKPIAHTRQFIEEIFRKGQSLPDLTSADKSGYTKKEYDYLSKPIQAFSLKSISYGVQRFCMSTLGKSSQGIRIGWETGFDSGQSLDYVYENRVRGNNFIGKTLDRTYLNSIGWKGIRQRKVHLQNSFRECMERVRASGKPVRVVDIAAGPGRYILEVLKESPYKDIEVLLRDWSETGLEAGRALARSMNLTNVRYERGDAFDTQSLSPLSPKPTIAIVSGLYELFPDNERIKASLSGLSMALREGGYLIYTNQPWHPQVEMIARVLINRDGKPWIMRRRTQMEMDQLVASAGFRKLSMSIDPWGIFTVSVAERII